MSVLSVAGTVDTERDQIVAAARSYLEPTAGAGLLGPRQVGHRQSHWISFAFFVARLQIARLPQQSLTEDDQARIASIMAIDLDTVASRQAAGHAAILLHSSLISFGILNRLEPGGADVPTRRPTPTHRPTPRARQTSSGSGADADSADENSDENSSDSGSGTDDDTSDTATESECGDDGQSTLPWTRVWSCEVAGRAIEW